MNRHQLLIDRLEVASIGLIALYISETDEVRKQRIAETSDQIIDVIDLLKAGKNSSELQETWNTIEKTFIKHGIKEALEAILDIL